MKKTYSKNIFLTILLLVSLGGYFLRLHNYAGTPPFGETRDEFFYPWAGITLLQTGTPSAWSPFEGYQNPKEETYWGTSFRMVTPWVEKPPLYSILTGGVSLLFGQNEFREVRLSTIRIVPIILNSVAIILLGLFAASLYGTSVGIVSAILYATIPTIVLANRLSLTENLLIPIILFCLWSYQRFRQSHQKWRLILVGVGCVCALLTKQIASILPLTLLVISFKDKRWRDLVFLGVCSATGFILSLILPLLFNWNAYLQVLSQYQSSHAIGLPQSIFHIFMYPVVGHKEKIILDGSMLLGYILLFSEGFRGRKEKSRDILLLFPLLYLVMFSLLVGAQTWYGWHLFPLFPFLALLIAIAFEKLYHETDLTQIVPMLLLLGISSLRFLLQATPQYVSIWPVITGMIMGVILVFWQFAPHQARQKLLLILFAVFICVNIFAVLLLPQTYGFTTQPLY